MFKIKKTSDSEENGLKIVIYGQPGSGKTSTIGSLPGKTLLLNAENGTRVLSDFDIDVIDITGGCIDPSEPEKYYSKMMHLESIYGAIKNKTLDYDNIAIDSISEVSDWIAADLKADEYYGDPKNSFKYWEEYKSRLHSLLKAFRDLDGRNVIMLALEAEVGELVKIKKPAVVGNQSKDKFVSYFDEVLYMDSRVDGSRFFRSVETSALVAKSRVGILAETNTTDLSELYFGKPNEHYVKVIKEKINKIKGKTDGE